MSAKLKIYDPNGKRVFDSSIDRVMRHLFTDGAWSVLFSGYGPVTYRYEHPSITRYSTFLQVTFLTSSWAYINDYGALKSPAIVKTYDGYAEITLNYQYFNNTSPYTAYFRVKGYRR
ncbi:hypothetical protein C9426_00880 [Serratia sp. S1B]|nr:hypothetical protein C9426_00880 [Serratia sp. S1B]